MALKEKTQWAKVRLFAETIICGMQNLLLRFNLSNQVNCQCLGLMIGLFVVAEC